MSSENHMLDGVEIGRIRIHSPPRGVDKTAMRCGVLPNYFEHLFHFAVLNVDKVICRYLQINEKPFQKTTRMYGHISFDNRLS